MKNGRGDVRPVASGEVLRKAAGKALAIDQKKPLKESSGRFQYGLNTPDGVNMVVLMVEDTMKQNVKCWPWRKGGEWFRMPSTL